MKHFTWLAVLASAMVAAEPPALEDAPVVDMAVLEIEPGERADTTLGAPLKRIAEELDRTLQLQLAPLDEPPESDGDYVAALR